MSERVQVIHGFILVYQKFTLTTSSLVIVVRSCLGDDPRPRRENLELWHWPHTDVDAEYGVFYDA